MRFLFLLFSKMKKFLESLNPGWKAVSGEKRRKVQNQKILVVPNFPLLLWKKTTVVYIRYFLIEEISESVQKAFDM